jgi:hypothetical protein
MTGRIIVRNNQAIVMLIQRLVRRLAAVALRWFVFEPAALKTSFGARVLNVWKVVVILLADFRA